MYLLIKNLIFIIIFSNENSQILFQLLFWPSQVVLIGLMQDEQLVKKGVRDMKRDTWASFLAPMEKSIRKKLCEKDVETEDINRKNRELVERIKQAAVEAQNWHYRAKYNESVVNLLKNNLHPACNITGG